jgi:hypothetical protein
MIGRLAKGVANPVFKLRAEAAIAEKKYYFSSF